MLLRNAATIASSGADKWSTRHYEGAFVRRHQGIHARLSASEKSAVHGAAVGAWTGASVGGIKANAEVALSIWKRSAAWQAGALTISYSGGIVQTPNVQRKRCSV